MCNPSLSIQYSDAIEKLKNITVTTRNIVEVFHPMINYEKLKNYVHNILPSNE
jgi:hypothetical protein